MLTLAAQQKRVVVVGGGLLGLEAAYELAKAGAVVTLVHLMDRLMERQLDARGRTVEIAGRAQGHRSPASCQHRAHPRRSPRQGVELVDGRRIDADAVISAARHRPIIALARRPASRSIAASSSRRPSADRRAGCVAVGECAEHRGICYGLVEPAYEQARVLAQHLAGSAGAYGGSVVATNLKVSGVSVFSGGDFMGAEGSEAIVLSDINHGTYKKLVISQED